MRHFDLDIRITPDDYDSDDVYIKDKKGNQIGYAYRSKDDGRFHIMRCPRCHLENYAMTISEGSCAWCGFTLNDKKHDGDSKSASRKPGTRTRNTRKRL